MNYTNSAELQQSPYPNSEFYVLHLHAPIQPLAHDPFQPSNVDSHSAMFLPPQPRPPGVDPPPPPFPVNYVQQPIGFEVQQGADASAAAAYYPDPNVIWVAAMPQFEATPYTAGSITISTLNPAIQPQNGLALRKAHKTKLVESARCGVCKIDCNSKGVLEQHKLGKKHLKNLQKLSDSTLYAPTIVAPIIIKPPTSTPLSVPAPAPVPPSACTDQPIIGPQENPEVFKSRSQKSRKRLAARIDDLETKRRKVMEGGAVANAVRACNICNVVCNSDTVFSHHLAGQKHALMAKKYALSAGVASAM